MKKSVTILINLGTPSQPSPKAIARFLWNFLSDKRVVKLPPLLWRTILITLILPFRSRKLVEAYESIWQEKGSPLEAGMKELVKRFETSPHSVKYAMCYSQPSIEKTMHDCIQSGYNHIHILPLYPQYAESLTATVYDQVAKALYKHRFMPYLSVCNHYYDHKNYILALSQSVKKYWEEHEKPQRLILSFHGIPLRAVEEGDPYASQCEYTAKALAKALNLAEHEWQLVYQSRFGKATWLQPYCDKTLASLPSQGIKKVHIICPGFSIDCLETLEEVAKTNKEIFLEAGGEEYHYIPALNASQGQYDLITQLIEGKHA